MIRSVQQKHDWPENNSELATLRRDLQRELQEAADFIHQKLPPRFVSDRMELDWQFIASSQLGGDMFGLERVDKDQYLIYLLDVSGHGIGASLLAVSIHNTLQQMLAFQSGPASPARIISGLNAAFQMEFNQNRFSTIWCGIVNFANHSITYASGGHPTPFFFGPDLRPVPIHGGGLLVGVAPDSEYEEYAVRFRPGCRLVLYSDGITEETTPDGKILGREGFRRWLVGNYSQPAPRLSRVIDRLEAWAGGRSFADDVSLVELNLKS
ncbi:MAG: PP2C family protein-serine/threonine phosphatase [Pirellulaceae bacterium]